MQPKKLSSRQLDALRFDSTQQPIAAHTPYRKIFNKHYDFVVHYRLNPDEALQSVTPHQGMRCDFTFASGELLYMIYPEILDVDGNIVLDKRQPIASEGLATMWVLLDSAPYLKRLKERLYVGQKAFWVVGSSVLAEVTVTEICL